MSYLQTYSGKKFDLKNPTLEQIDILDIIHGLCLEPRFSNQIMFNTHYTVAQHSIFACGLAPNEYKLEALLHDWPEFIIKDLPKPIKNMILNYNHIERRLEKVGAIKFNLEYPYPPIVKTIDLRLAKTEALRLMKGKAEHLYLYENITPYNFSIKIWNYDECYEKFWKMWEMYKRV